MSLVLGVVLVVLLMAASGVLVAAETSLLHIRRAQAEVLADSGTEADDSVDRSDLLDLLDDRVRGLGPLLFVLMALRLSAAGLLAIVVADRVMQSTFSEKPSSGLSFPPKRPRWPPPPWRWPGS